MTPKHIIAGSSNPHLAHGVASLLELPVDETQLGMFDNQELRVKLSNKARHSIIVQSLSIPVDRHIIETILLADAAKRFGSERITGIFPWFAYSKQDKVFTPGEPLSVKAIGKLIQSAPFTDLITVDLHNESIQGYLDIPITNLSARTIFIDHLAKRDLQDHVVVSPDAGSVKNATKFADSLGLPVVYVNKRRDLITGKVSIASVSDRIDGKAVIIIDDMISTGSTLIAVADALKEHSVDRLIVCATHHLWLKGVQQKLVDSKIDELIVSDSIMAPNELDDMTTVLPLAPLIASAL